MANGTNHNNIAEDLERAWQYHKEADQLLHSRISSLLIAESFLVISAVSVVISQYRDYAIQFYLLIAITSLGIFFKKYLILMNLRINKRIAYLKDNYLKKDKIYMDYLNVYVQSESETNLLPIQMPRLLLYFWYAMVPICILFAVKLYLTEVR